MTDITNWRTTSRLLSLVAYHGVVRWLPASRGPGGTFFRRLRTAIARPALGAMGVDVNIERGANIGTGYRITIGDRSSIGINASLHGPVSIGRNVMMGPDVMIFALGHATDRVDIPMIDQGNRPPDPVRIGDDVWIGARVILLPGVAVGDGCIIGAGAVVSKSIPAYSIAAGNPARVVRSRAGSA